MNLQRAIEIAAEAHREQTDKAGAPYLLHPLRVMMSLDTDDERIVGILHDVVEDGCRVAVNDETGRFGSPFDPKILPINMSRPSQQYDFNGLSDPVRYSVVSELWATISQLRAKYHI